MKAEIVKHEWKTWQVGMKFYVPYQKEQGNLIKEVTCYDEVIKNTIDITKYVHVYEKELARKDAIVLWTIIASSIVVVGTVITMSIILVKRKNKKTLA